LWFEHPKRRCAPKYVLWGQWRISLLNIWFWADWPALVKTYDKATLICSFQSVRWPLSLRTTHPQSWRTLLSILQTHRIRDLTKTMRCLIMRGERLIVRATVTWHHSCDTHVNDSDGRSDLPTAVTGVDHDVSPWRHTYSVFNLLTILCESCDSCA
jgi:hypothetical protein